MARCIHIMPTGEPCRANALRGDDYCLFHSPERQDEVEEARRLGGLRRRRERTVAAAYDYQGLRSISDVLRVLESAVTDALSLENTVERCRTLAQLSEIARRCITSDYEDRIRVLEAALRSRDLTEDEELDPDLEPLEHGEEQTP